MATGGVSLCSGISVAVWLDVLAPGLWGRRGGLDPTGAVWGPVLVWSCPSGLGRCVWVCFCGVRRPCVGVVSHVLRLGLVPVASRRLRWFRVGGLLLLLCVMCACGVGVGVGVGLAWLCPPLALVCLRVCL